MSRVSTSSASSANSAFACPEWAKLPSPAGPVPVPYPNTAGMAPSTSSSAKVNVLQTQGLSKAGAQDAVEGKVVNNPVDKAVLRGMSSKIPATSGDEAGSNGGPVSGVQAGKVVFKPTGMAGSGPATGGAAASPSQAKIFVAQ